MVWILTGDESSKEPNSLVWRNAVRPELLEDILSEGESSDGVPSRHEDEKTDPEVEEGRERTERLVDVGVVTSRLGDEGTYRSDKHKLNNITNKYK